MRDLYELKNNFDKYYDVETELVVSGNIHDPEISIFIPTYNRSDTLELTIISALSQITSTRYEIIVINNNPCGKDDETKDLIESFNDNRIYYYVNEKNIGLCGNWNRGIELARANYISMIHDDDVLSPYFIESVRKAIDDNNHPGIIGVDYVAFNSSNVPSFQKPQHTDYRTVTKKSFFFGKYINIAGMTVKKEMITTIGGYSEEYYPNEDTNLIYQALIIDNVININFPLAGYRKEVNLSLSDGIMKQIIIMMEDTRRNISQHEKFASDWLKKFDKEYLYQYIKSASQHWNLEIDYKEIFEHYGLPCRRPSKIKMALMKIQIKIMRLVNEI